MGNWRLIWRIELFGLKSDMTMDNGTWTCYLFYEYLQVVDFHNSVNILSHAMPFTVGSSKKCFQNLEAGRCSRSKMLVCRFLHPEGDCKRFNVDPTGFSFRSVTFWKYSVLQFSSCDHRGFFDLNSFKVLPKSLHDIQETARSNTFRLMSK